MTIIEAILIGGILGALLYIIHVLMQKPPPMGEKVIILSKITGKKYIIEPRGGVVGMVVVDTKNPAAPPKHYLLLAVVPDLTISSAHTWEAIQRIGSSIKGHTVDPQFPIRDIHFSEITHSRWAYKDQYGNIYELFPRRAYVVRMEIPDADKAREALDRFLYIVQEQNKGDKKAGLLPTYLPVGVVLETYPELHVIPSPVKVPERRPRQPLPTDIEKLLHGGVEI